MLRMEMYKIAFRRIVLLGTGIILVYLLGWFWMSELGSEGVIGGGKVYVRSAAIKRNQEIAAPYEGALTMDKVRDIWETYGPPVNSQLDHVEVDLVKGIATEGFEDNYCNQFVSRRFYDTTYLENNEIVYQAREEASVSPFLQSNLYFGYAGGWDWYWDKFLMLFVLISVLVIIALSPVFSEEYALRTADVILTTRNGRQRIFWTKLGAAMGYTSVAYWGINGALFLMTGAAYGYKGLRVSTIYTNVPGFWRELPVGTTILLLLLCGWLAELLLGVITIAVSARCRLAFTSVLWSLFLFLAPAALTITLLEQLRRTPLVRILLRLTYSLPFLLPGRLIEMPGAYWPQFLAISAFFGLLAVWLGNRWYCRHQI